MPDPPLDAVIVVLPQKVPPPAATTVAGNAFTVTLAVVIQPVDNVYVIAVVPADMPATTPDDASTVPTPVIDELHVPPVLLLVRAVVEPAHTLRVPVIADGNELTVTVVVMIQPLAKA